MSRSALFITVLISLTILPCGSDDLLTLPYPRLEASDGERELLAELETWLDDIRVPYRRFDFSDSVSAHSFSSCLEVDLTEDVPDTLIIGVPVKAICVLTWREYGYSS